MKPWLWKQQAAWILAALILTACCVSCTTGIKSPATPDHGRLGASHLAPHGWTDYKQRGGQ